MPKGLYDRQLSVTFEHWEGGRWVSIRDAPICALPPPLPFLPTIVEKQLAVKGTVYRLHTAILNRPLSSAATMEVQGPDTT